MPKNELQNILRGPHASSSDPDNAILYWFEKINEGISSVERGGHNIAFGQAHLNTVKEAVNKFKSALTVKGEFSDRVEHDVSLFLHALGRIEEYLTGETTLSESDAYIFCRYCRNEYSKLMVYAKEIDEEK